MYEIVNSDTGKVVATMSGHNGRRWCEEFVETEYNQSHCDETGDITGPYFLRQVWAVAS